MLNSNDLVSITTSKVYIRNVLSVSGGIAVEAEAHPIQ